MGNSSSVMPLENRDYVSGTVEYRVGSPVPNNTDGSNTSQQSTSNTSQPSISNTPHQSTSERDLYIDSKDILSVKPKTDSFSKPSGYKNVNSSVSRQFPIKYMYV